MKMKKMICGLMCLILPGLICGLGVASASFLNEYLWRFVFQWIFYASTLALVLNPIFVRFYFCFFPNCLSSKQIWAIILATSFIVPQLETVFDLFLNKSNVNTNWSLFVMIAVFLLVFFIFLLLYFSDLVIFDSTQKSENDAKNNRVTPATSPDQYQHEKTLAIDIHNFNDKKDDYKKNDLTVDKEKEKEQEQKKEKEKENEQNEQNEKKEKQKLRIDLKHKKNNLKKNKNRVSSPSSAPPDVHYQDDIEQNDDTTIIGNTRDDLSLAAKEYDFFETNYNSTQNTGNGYGLAHDNVNIFSGTVRSEPLPEDVYSPVAAVRDPNSTNIDIDKRDLKNVDLLQNKNSETRENKEKENDFRIKSAGSSPSTATVDSRDFLSLTMQSFAYQNQNQHQNQNRKDEKKDEKNETTLGQYLRRNQLGIFINGSGDLWTMHIKHIKLGKILIFLVPLLIFIILNALDNQGILILDSLQQISITLTLLVVQTFISFHFLNNNQKSQKQNDQKIEKKNYWNVRSNSLICLPVFSLFFLFAVSVYCSWLVNSSFALRTNSNSNSNDNGNDNGNNNENENQVEEENFFLLLIHVLLSFGFQTCYEFLWSYSVHPYLYARLSFFLQMTATLPQYILLSQTPWSTKFVIVTVVTSIHSTLSASQIYSLAFKKLLYKFKKKSELDEAIEQNQWFQVLKYEYYLRIFGQTTLCEIWAIFTVIVSNATLYMFNNLKETNALKQLETTNWIGPSQNDLNDLVRIVLLISCKILAWITSRWFVYVYQQSIQKIESQNVQALFQNYINVISENDLFLQEELTNCFFYDYPFLISPQFFNQKNKQQNKQNQKQEKKNGFGKQDYLYQLLTSPYSAAAIFFLLFSSLTTPSNSVVRSSWFF